MADIETTRDNDSQSSRQRLIDDVCNSDEDGETEPMRAFSEGGDEGEEEEEYKDSDSDDDPPATVPGSLLVSRIVWEVVRTCDINIRNDFKTQVKSLLEICHKLDIANQRVPQDMQTVHRLLWRTNQLSWKLSQAADNSENKLWTKYHMYKNYEEVVDLLQSSLRPVAATWHSARRCQMLKKHPEIKFLLRDDPMTLVVMALIIYLHLSVALFLGRVDTIGEDNDSFLGKISNGGISHSLIIFVAAYCFGGFMSFGFQSLDHELSHTVSTPILSNVLGLMGSGCTTVPWYSYYFSGGHERHHKFAGTPRDIDRCAYIC
jgi:hypothetical protein